LVRSQTCHSVALPQNLAPLAEVLTLVCNGEVVRTQIVVRL